MCGAIHFQGPGLLQHCRNKSDEYYTASAFYLTTLFKKRMGLTQAAVHHEENDQSRITVDASEQISDHYYQSVDRKESDCLNQVNKSIVDKACDNVGDLAICDDVEKYDAFTSIRQESQCDIDVSDYDVSSDEQIFAENQAKNVQDEQELPGQCTHHIEIINSIGEATDGNDDPSTDPDHTIDAEKSIIDEPDCTLDSMSIQLEKQMKLMVILVKNLMLQSMQRIATFMSLILFMTGPKQLTRLLSRQNQWLMMILIIMIVRGAKQDDNYGASNIVLPCSGS